MSEYIHSGVAGKINRIVKPHIGNILVTSEYGNAKESTLTEATLKAAVNDINRIKYAVTYKGEKATVDALPTTGNTKGDMWNVTYCTTLFWRNGNMLTNKIASGNSEQAIKQSYIFGGTPIFSDEDFSGFTIYGQTLPIGMTITVYGAQEVE